MHESIFVHYQNGREQNLESSMKQFECNKMKYSPTIISGCNYYSARHYAISMALLYMCFQNLTGQQIKLSLKERKMAAQTPSTFRLIGAGVTSVGALAAIFGAGGSNAQTLANLQESDRAAYLQTHCGRIRDANLQVGCIAQRSIEFDEARAEAARERAKAANATAAAARKEADEHRKATAEHQKAIAKSDAAIAKSDAAITASRTAAQCLSAISAALTANPPRITVAEARAAKTTPTPSDDPCVWRERLAPRLGALTKQ